MSKKVTIHIGMPKTGSTWLQTFILPALTSIDVCYRESFRYSVLEWSNKNLLISYENFVGYPYILESRGMDGWMKTRERALANLSFLFPAADIILIVRKQTELVKSLYNQYVRIGGHISFHDYIAGNSKYSLEKHALEYMPLINWIKNIFSGRILLINYNLFQNNKEKFGQIFLDFTGADDYINFSKSGSVKINKSLSRVQVKYLTLLNRMFRNDYSPDGLRLPGKKTYKRMRKAVLSLACLASWNEPDGIYKKEDIETIDEYYLEDWSKIKSMLNREYLIVERDDLLVERGQAVRAVNTKK